MIAGVVHYGDSVPAEYSQSERTVLNGQGVELSHIEAAQRRSSRPKQSPRRRREQRAQHDRFLLATYLPGAENRAAAR